MEQTAATSVDPGSGRPRLGWGNQPALDASSFAAMLAELTAPEGRSAESALPAWNDDQLADDVASLSYEGDLRAAAQAGDAGGWGFAPPAGSAKASAGDGAVSDATAAALMEALMKARGETPVKAAREAAAPLERSRKCVSITLRMSEQECAQLKARASEAGLTMSAYLRSCTFEADALRAQVREALAELRNPPPVEVRKRPTDPPRPPRMAWLSRLAPHRHSAQRLAQA